jgi:hypothetical protein
MLLTINDYYLGPQVVNTQEITGVICDIDGTIADCSHRLHWIESKPKNWKAFYAGVLNDAPILHMLFQLDTFAKEDIPIVLCSGRGEECRGTTIQWLYDNDVPFMKLYMRPAKDYRQDYIVKEELLAQILADGFKPNLVLDDRTQVVEMWRHRGLRTIQVAFGDF